jgi:tRNA pseudouridine65 synthase
MTLEILYQDEWLVAVNKPSGWLVHRSWLDRDEKVVVMQTVRDQIGQHVFTAHRLDRPTSGVLLMGLSSEAGRLLSQQFEQHQIQKRYHAIVRGWLTEPPRWIIRWWRSWTKSPINLPAMTKARSPP